MTGRRFVGHCHGCRRDDREVETRYDRGARTLCDVCAERTPPAPTHAPEPSGEEALHSPSAIAVPAPVHVPVPVPYLDPEEGDAERADLRVLLDLYAEARAPVERVPLPELPGWATSAMERVLRDVAFCSGLLRAAGDDGTVIYAVDWAAGRLGLSGKTVSVALRALRRCGALRLVRTLPPVEGEDGRRRRGSRVYAVSPPVEGREVRPSLGPGAARDVEAGERAAVRPAGTLGSAALEPLPEVVEEPGVRGAVGGRPADDLDGLRASSGGAAGNVGGVGHGRSSRGNVPGGRYGAGWMP